MEGERDAAWPRRARGAGVRERKRAAPRKADTIRERNRGWLVDHIEVMGMNRTTWLEARRIAARQGRGGASDAGEDLAQDLAVAALEASGEARRPGAWLERVGRNAVIDRWRVESRRGELAPEIEPPVALPDPEAALLGRERRGLVRRALAGLPRPQRRAALARFHAELPFDEVAVRLGTPPVTARTRVHRALAVLRSKLGGLRAVLVLPGVHATALGLVLIVAEAPGLAPGRAPADGNPTPEVTVPARHFARTRVIAAESRPSVPPAAKPSAKPAAAETAETPAPIPPPQVFVFDPDSVEGGVARPDGDEVRVVRPAIHSSLIEIRRHFVAELVKTMEDF
jgi:RNA polymerase sigma factor (sigma-70 family)